MEYSLNNSYSYFAYINGKCKPNKDVVTVWKAYDVEDQLDIDKLAHLIVYRKEFEPEKGRLVIYKKERTYGTVLEDLAIISKVVVAGGDASDYAPIIFAID